MLREHPSVFNTRYLFKTEENKYKYNEQRDLESALPVTILIVHVPLLNSDYRTSKLRILFIKMRQNSWNY